VSIVVRYKESESTKANSFVHLGRASYGAQSLGEDFPQAQNMYWHLTRMDLPSRKDCGFIRQADDVLQSLRENQTREPDDDRGKPIIFVCWGVAGGVLFKEVHRQSHSHTSLSTNIHVIGFAPTDRRLWHKRWVVWQNIWRVLCWVSTRRA
jgi:hypothetical protein